MSSILVVGHDQIGKAHLESMLASAGHTVRLMPDGDVGMLPLRDWQPDLLLLDLAMSYPKARETCERIRAFAKVPLIVLSFNGRESAAQEYLDAGADDYLAKPFHPGELLARIRAVLRRASSREPANVTTFDFDLRWVIDFDRRELRIDDEAVQLSSTEFDLLAHLVKNAGHTVSPEELLSKVWGPQFADANGYVKLYIWYLRQKLEADPKQPRRIVTRRGQGYMFERRRRPRGPRPEYHDDRPGGSGWSENLDCYVWRGEDGLFRHSGASVAGIAWQAGRFVLHRARRHGERDLSLEPGVR